MVDFDTDIEYDDSQQITWAEWNALSVENRAIILGEAVYRSQISPETMAPSDWFLLGMALEDKEAMRVANESGIAANAGYDFEDAATYGAAVDAWREAQTRRPDDEEWLGLTNDALREGISATGAVDADAFTGRAAVAIGVTGGPLVAGWALSATGAGSAIASGASALKGSAAAWYASSPATAAIGNAIRNIAFQRGLDANGLLKAAHLVGPSAFGSTLRTIISNPVVQAGGSITAGLASKNYIIDALLAAFPSLSTIEEFRADREQQINSADLQKAGYEVSKDGVILAAGEEFLFAAGDETVTVKDPDGNVIAQEDIDQLTNQQEVPDPFAAPTEGAPVPTTAGTPFYGAADQYRTTSAGSGEDALLAQIEGVLSGAGGASFDGDVRTKEQRLQDYLDEQEAIRRANPLIAVDEGYTRVTDPNVQRGIDILGNSSTGQSMFGDYRGTEDILSGSDYRRNDIQRELSSLTNQQLIDFQERAIQAKLIDPKSRTSGYFRLGQLDGQTFDAMQAAMGQANINGNGESYQDAMDGMIAAVQEYERKFGSPAGPTWTPSRAYFAPDYATISQGVKGLFRQSLGRDPNGWEMDLLADQFRSDHRAAYDQQMAGERAVFEASGRAQETGIVETPADQTAIDPAARMQEGFEDQFSNELDARSRWADVKSKGRNLFGSLNKLGG